MYFTTFFQIYLFGLTISGIKKVLFDCVQHIDSTAGQVIFYSFQRNQKGQAKCEYCFSKGPGYVHLHSCSDETTLLVPSLCLMQFLTQPGVKFHLFLVKKHFS